MMMLQIMKLDDVWDKQLIQGYVVNRGSCFKMVVRESGL